MSFIIFPGVITPPLTPGAVPYGTGSQVLMNTQGTAGQLLQSNGGSAPTWITPSGIPPAPLTAGGVVYGTGTAVAVSAAGTAGQVLTSNGTGAPTWSGAGTGDVVGPSSATDNAITRFDTTTGKLIQNSAATVADTTGTITNAGEYVAAGGSISTVAFGSTTGTTDTGIFFPGADIVGFSSAGVERMRIPAAGGVQAVTTISVGNATPAASGAGITFPATQSASADVNTLDDYEEGTWTPSVGGNATYGIDVGGRYVKIGKTVTVWGKIQIATLGTGSSSLISGLPFSMANNGLEGNGACGYFNVLAVNVITPQCYVVTGLAIVGFYSITTPGTGVSSVSIFGNNARMYFTVTYETSA